MEAILLAMVQRFSRLVLQDENAFASELQAMWTEKQAAKPQQNRSEQKRMKKRYDELTEQICGLYENFTSGLLSERQYKQIMKQYDDEQAELENKMAKLEESISEESKSSLDINHFLDSIISD